MANPAHRPRLELTGRRFGRLVVLARAVAGSRSYWTCRCDCGVETTVRGSDLTRWEPDRALSCGCARRERMARLGRERRYWLYV